MWGKCRIGFARVHTCRNWFGSAGPASRPFRNPSTKSGKKLLRFHISWGRPNQQGSRPLSCLAQTGTGCEPTHCCNKERTALAASCISMVGVLAEVAEPCGTWFALKCRGKKEMRRTGRLPFGPWSSLDPLAAGASLALALLHPRPRSPVQRGLPALFVSHFMQWWAVSVFTLFSFGGPTSSFKELCVERLCWGGGQRCRLYDSSCRRPGSRPDGDAAALLGPAFLVPIFFGVCVVISYCVTCQVCYLALWYLCSILFCEVFATKSGHVSGRKFSKRRKQDTGHWTENLAKTWGCFAGVWPPRPATTWPSQYPSSGIRI